MSGVAFSPDGTKIISGGPDRVVRVWDATSGAELLSHKDQPEGVTHVAFSPDGKQYVCSYAFKTPLFDLATGQPIRNLELAADNWQRGAFRNDGRQVISSSPYGIVIADVETGTQLLKVDARKGDSTTSNPVFSPDGKSFAGGGGAGSVTVWDSISGKELMRNFGDVGAIRSLAFSPDGKFLVSGSARLESESYLGKHIRNGEIQLWDAATSELVQTFKSRPVQDETGVLAGPRTGPIAPRPVSNRNAAEHAARANAMQGDWKGAVLGYAQMFEIQPIDNGEPGFESAAVLLLAGDKEGYQQRCAELLEKSGRAGIRSYHVARACTLAPDSVKDFAVPAQKAENELNRSREFWSLTQQGALACRSGRLDEAARLSRTA